MAADNVDMRLLRRFEASLGHERSRRELLPPEWINAEPAPEERLRELYDDVIERARERVRVQREALDAHPSGDELDPAV